MSLSYSSVNAGLILQTRHVRPVASGGQTLPQAQRQFFETTFETDLSGVRIYTDGQAAIDTRLRGANAATSGEQIAFAPGKFGSTSHAQRLLAHELAHVIQQRQAQPQLASLPPPGTAQIEARANQAAGSVGAAAGATPDVGHAPAGGVYCDESDKKADSAPLLPLAPRLQLNPLLFPPTGMPSTSFGLGLDPKATDFIPPLSRFTPFNKFSNADVLSTFSAYGTSPGRAGFNMGEDLQRVYWMLRSYLPESLAASFTSGALGATYAASLARDQPNIFDKSNLDFKAAYPNASATPIIPFFSSSTMTSLYEAISGKKNTNQFYF